MDSSAAVNSTVKTPEAESEAPTPRIQPIKRGGSPFGTANGVLKRHAPSSQQTQQQLQVAIQTPVVVAYKECLKNHAASIGGHAVDGCGEFMPSPGSNPVDPTSLKCAACGCHRNFHRREPDEIQAVAAMEYRSHHRHQPPPPPPPPLLQTNHGDDSGGGGGGSSPNDSPSPPPISSSYYHHHHSHHPTAPQMLLALSHGVSNPVAVPIPNPSPIGAASAAINVAAGVGVGVGGGTIATNPNVTNTNNNNNFSSSSRRKRFRTKFTANQKQQMLELAEKVEWKMQKKDDDLISDSCSQIGVERGVFKVWMHNNKNTFIKRDTNTLTTTTPSSTIATTTTNTAAGINGMNYTNSPTGDSLNHHTNTSSSPNHGTNGSTSSS